MWKTLICACLIAGTVALHAATTEQVSIALTTLERATAGPDQVHSYFAYFCRTTQQAIRDGRRGWYTTAQADYRALTDHLSAADRSRFAAPLQAFASVFDAYDGN